MSAPPSGAADDPLAVLRDLASGEAAAAAALLPACRAEAFGVEAFGGLAIAELFARHAQPLGPDPHIVRTDRGLAVFDAGPDGREQAFLADLYGGRIGRLWRVGAAAAAAAAAALDAMAEASLGVAFDPFLSQRRVAACAWERGDTPDLDDAACAALDRLAPTLTVKGAVETLPLTLRAFGGEGKAAALFALQANTGALWREPVATLAMAAFRHDGSGALLHRRVITDGSVAAPRLARLIG